MRIDAKRYQAMPALQRVALGQEKADLAIVNCSVVNVLTREVYPGEVYVSGGVIVHVEYDPAQFQGAGASAATVYDAQGGYVAPGFLDAHVHCESSMLTPYEFLRTIAVHGTTAVFTDPHEIANVCGVEGVRFMLQDEKCAPIRQFVLAPSCVPAVPGLESTGAAFFKEEVNSIFDLDAEKVVGLAEVMDYPNVVSGEARMAGVLEAARERDIYIQSHYAGLFGRELSSYLLAAARGGNHELRAREELQAVVRAGGRVDIRGGSSIADNFEQLLEALSAFPMYEAFDTISFCTDDVHAKDLLDCHINRTVARAVAWGMDAVSAIRFCTYNTAQAYGIRNMGAVAVDYLADLVVLGDLASMQPKAVFVAGEQIAQDGKLLRDIPNSVTPPSALLGTMNMGQVAAEDLRIMAPDPSAASVKVNVMRFSGLIGSSLETEELPVVEGAVSIQGREDLAYVAIFNRYGTGKKTVAIVKDFNLVKGAGATTVSHDSHNLTVVFKDSADALRVVEAIRQAGGGIGAAYGDRMEIVPLPVGGLMSTEPASELAPKIEKAEALLHEISRTGEFTLLALATLALPVIPMIRITDMGIVDVLKQEFVPLFAE